MKEIARGLGILVVCVLAMGCLIACSEEVDVSPEDVALVENMQRLRHAIESYQGEHDKYPESLIPPKFQWDRYVEGALVNPYNPSLKGAQVIEENIIVKSSDRPKPTWGVSNSGRKTYMKRPGGVLEHVMSDTRAFKAPGMIRYYVDKDHTIFAITGANKNRQPFRQDGTNDGPIYIEFSDV